MLKTLCKTTLKNSGVLPWMLCALFLSTTTSAYSTATNAALTGQDSEAFTKVKNIVDDPGANREQMEGALQTLKKMTEKYSQDPFIKTYYALALATQPKYEAKIQKKQL